jgi:cobalt-zinc-cadmium efflux system membrane fusion protein
MKKTSLPLLLLLSALALAPLSTVSAHDGGHDEATPGPAANGPQRLPDGSVFLPKLSQRQLAIRTVMTERKELPQTLELAGKVIMNPNAGGKVQALMLGRVEAGPHGLPVLGQSVKKGEVLAYVRPSDAGFERARQLDQSQELRASQIMAEKRLARLQQLEGSVPQKEIDAARIEVQSLRQRAQSVSASLSASEVIAAPVSGVIASSNVVAGQVVDAHELLFEIIDPQQMRIEALAYDVNLAGNIGAASASTGGSSDAGSVGGKFDLELVGTGRALKEQALPIQFRLRPNAAGKPDADGSHRVVQDQLLSLGQPMRVFVQTKSRSVGVPIPALAIVKNPANQDSVWVHVDAERFAQKTIRWRALDAANVSVTDGLQADERVVVQGAPLLNQVR